MSDEWEDVGHGDSGWEDVPSDFKATPTETFLHSMIPTGLASAAYGAREAAPDVLHGDFSKGLDTYRKNRDESRKVFEQSEKTNPRAALAGSIAPWLAAPAMGVGGAAATGGAYGLANSKADLTKLNDPEQLKKAALDTGIGTAIGGATGGLAKFAPKSTAAAATGALAGQMISPEHGALPGAMAGLALRGAASPAVTQYLTKKFNNSFLDVLEGDSELYMTNPEGVNSAMSNPEMAQKMADTLGDVQANTGNLANVAKSTLSGAREPVKGLDVNTVVGALDKFDNPDAKALSQKIMDSYQQRIGGISPEQNAEFLTQQEAGEVKKLLQGLGDFNSALPNSDKAAANFESGNLNRTLKGANPDYDAAMGELSQNMQTKNALAQKFGIKRDFTGNNKSGYTFSDSTISALKDLVNSKKVDRARILDSLKEQGYGDLANDIQNTMAKNALTGGGAAQGSRKAKIFGAAGSAVGATVGSFLGGGLGAGVGATVGGAIGAAGGGVIDKYGPQFAKSMMDSQSTVQRLMSNPTTQKFAGPLQNALKRGQDSFASTYYLMQQSDPEFRKATSAGQ